MKVVVFGCNGPVGSGVVEHYAAAGAGVLGVCRSGRARVPQAVQVVSGDAADAEHAVRLAAGADLVFGCMGLPYPEWLAKWPSIIQGLLAAAEHSGARLVFADNLYSYGPQTQPLREDMPLTDVGRKPALRARMTRQMLGAHRDGRVRVALVRASDFYGPGVTNAMLGERVFRPLLAGKAAQVLGDADQPHCYTYAPDFVKGLVTVAASDDAYGGIWHVPSAPALTPRRIVAMIAGMVGTSPRVTTLPGWVLSGLALVSPLMRELKEMSFQTDRPYEVDHAKYAARFGGGFTPMEEGLRTTLAWYRRAV